MKAPRAAKLADRVCRGSKRCRSLRSKERSRSHRWNNSQRTRPCSMSKTKPSKTCQETAATQALAPLHPWVLPAGSRTKGNRSRTASSQQRQAFAPRTVQGRPADRESSLRCGCSSPVAMPTARRASMTASSPDSKSSAWIYAGRSLSS